ncbi:DNA polymerase IV [Conexibacter sp. W3-3-2]|nr:DNA polymerase IV [Conexibacter sp. W3-3-2]
MFVSVPSVLHADLDAFFASVAQRDDPALRGRPVSVGGGVVMAASYEARARGVRSGMGGAKARALCPDLVVVRPDFDAYVRASRAVMAILDRFGARVEQASIDEAFLDVHPRDGRTVAAELRSAVREEVGLPISVGVAPSRTVAKVASGMAKPDGLLVVEPDGLFDFLHPLPVGRLWGIGPATERRLQQHGIRTVGDAARVGDGVLVTILGRSGGRRLDAIAHGREVRTVRPRRGRRSYGAQRALSRSRPTDLDDALVALVERIARRMAGRGQAGRTVVLRLRFGDYSRATRSRSLPRPTADADAMVALARSLLQEARPLIAQRGCTLIGVALTNIETHDDAQLALPFDEVG